MKNENKLEKIPYVKIILFAVLFSFIFTDLFVTIGKEKVIDAKITQVDIENEDSDEIYDKIWKMWDFFGSASMHSSEVLEEEKRTTNFTLQRMKDSSAKCLWIPKNFMKIARTEL